MRARWWLWLTPPAATLAFIGALVWLPAPVTHQASPPLPAATPTTAPKLADKQSALPKPSVQQVPPMAVGQRFGAVRDVGGGSVEAPVTPGEPLERIAPPPKPEPPPELAAEVAVVAPPPKPVLLFQPVVEAAGIINAEGRNINLAGVMPTGIDRTCAKAGDGGTWPCGMQARTAFRQLVRGRAITCTLPDQHLQEVEADCRIGAVDLGEWLVEQGWAEAAPGSDLERFADTARRLGRGIHSNGIQSGG